jgi:hypothetical protein
LENDRKRAREKEVEQKVSGTGPKEERLEGGRRDGVAEVTTSRYIQKQIIAYKKCMLEQSNKHGQA